MDKLITTDTKRCAKCGVTKTRAEMRASSASKDGMYSYCKTCHNKESMERKRADPEKTARKMREYRARMRENNLDELRSREKRERDRAKERGYFAQYYLKNRDSERVKRRKYYTINKERWREYGKIYRVNNPEKIAENNHKRRRGRETGEYYTKDQWIELCTRYNNVCLCCGKRVKLTVDHIIPICKGGSNQIDNIQPLCYPCNLKKWKQTIDYRH